MVNPGGIDFNSQYLDLVIKRDRKGVALPLIDQSLEQMQINIQGFVPIIINITPVYNLPLQMGLNIIDRENNNKQFGNENKQFGNENKQVGNKNKQVDAEKNSDSRDEDLIAFRKE